ncbi:MAG: hypothetical protein OEZ68_16655 [Gammaproteobacteria bacterium]|nr:hypothetical protein [Gammaproteobacteria bacterium]MDH5802434.1 hypothetical protein [Gammaproteobacteria bacterium]
MLQLFKHFFDLCRFKSPPEQTPYSLQLMSWSIITYMAMAYLVFSPNMARNIVILLVCVDMAMLLGFVYAGLWVCGYVNRMVKVVTAVAASGSILYVAGSPILYVLHQYAELSVIPTGLFAVWTLWKVAVTAYIIRHGLSIPIWLSVGVSVLYVYTYLRVLAAIIISGLPTVAN